MAKPWHPHNRPDKYEGPRGGEAQGEGAGLAAAEEEERAGNHGEEYEDPPPAEGLNTQRSATRPE